MSERERIAAALAREWPQGVCHYCGVTDDQVDGDRRRWLGMRRTVCSGSSCIARFNADVDRAEAASRKRLRKRTPADVHELIREEERAKRKKYREAAKARKGRVA